MSVYTQLKQQDIDALLQQYNCGTCRQFHGIEAGVTNTIYSIETTQNHFILTLFEELTSHQLPFYLHLMDFLADKGIPCPTVITTKSGESILSVHQKPAVLISYLPGETLTKVQVPHCQAVGKTLASMHLKGLSFPEKQNSTRGPAWHKTIAEQLYPILSNNESTLLHEEMAYAEQHPLTQLPQGIIHADLFRDNVLFEGNKLSGLLDFYYACNGALSYDLAIAICDWCFDDKDNFLSNHYQAILSTYQTIRPLTQQEQHHWPATLRQAGLRFWLSRLYDYHLGPSGSLIQKKDPKAFQRRVEFYRSSFH